MYKEEILPGQMFNWSKASITVPCEIPPTNLGGNLDNIKVDYELKFRVVKEEKVFELNKVLTVTIPIIIGTVPLQQQEY